MRGLAISELVTRLKRVEDPKLRDLLLWARSVPQLAARGHLAGRRITSRYLSASDAPRLHIGAGPHGLAGWLNSDLISGDLYLNLRRRLPLPDERFAYVFGEHVIEHLSEADGTALFAELHRVVRPLGVVRLTTPDLRKLIALYENRNPEIGLGEYMPFFDQLTGKRHERACQVFNDYLRLWGHRYVYDEEDLAAKLRQAGFERVQRVEPGESEHEPLRGLERHGGAAWINRAEAMCLEATRA
jgi:predicted SAM-dependent methyltransferase